MSRTKRPRNTNIGGKVVQHTGNNADQFQGHRSRSPGRLMLRPKVHHIFRTGRPTNFKLGTETEYEEPHQQQTTKVKVARSGDASDRCWPISRERNILETTKLVGRLSTPRAIMRTSFKVKGQRSKSPGRHAETGSTLYLTNGKAYELQAWCIDGARRLALPTSAVTSKVKVARSRDASGRCWPISRERNVLETPKLVGRLPT